MTSRRTRVLHVVNNLNYGGMERLVAEIARRTDPERFETHVLALDYIGHFGEGLGTAAELHIGGPMPRWSMLYPRALAAQISTIAPDAVHLHSGVLYKASLAAALAGVPFQIYTDHGRQHPEPWLNRFIDRQASRRLDVVAAVSGPLGERLAQIVKDPSRIRIVHNGVDTERYSPRSEGGKLRGELRVAADTPVIGSVGRLESVKGYSVLVSAFAKLRSSWTEPAPPVLLLVGEGSDYESLKRLAADLGVAAYVIFMGWRSDIEEILSALTLFAMSSHSEGTSVSLLEAMSSGLCPVVTDVGGNAGVLGADLQHRLVPPDDPDAMANALRVALRDSASRQRDSALARARIVDHFGLDAMVRQYEAFYSSAVNPSRQL